MEALRGSAPQHNTQAIAQDLHDSIAQSLSAANFMLQALIEQQTYPEAQTREMLVRAHLTTRTANAELRRIIDLLRTAEVVHQHVTPLPSKPIVAAREKPLSPGSQKLVAIDRLRRLGLVAALMEYFKNATNDTVALIFVPNRYQNQSLELEVELFRVAQEAVSNAIRHGQAKTICITLSVLANRVELLIEDDGNGSAINQRNGMGLGNMQARAARIGGEVIFGASKSGGVSVQLLAPSQAITMTAMR